MTATQSLVDERENLRIRVAADMNERLSQFSSTRRISKQDIIEGMLEWMLAQDDLTQAMVLRQIPASPDLVELVLSRLADEAANAGPAKKSQRTRIGRIFETEKKK